MSLATHRNSDAELQEFIPDIRECVNIQDIPRTEIIRGLVDIGRTSVGWTLEVPFEPTIDCLAIFIPGFGGFKATSREPRRALANEGITTVSYGPVRACDSSAIQRLLHAQDAHVETLEGISDSVAHSDDAQKTLRAFGVNSGQQWLVSHSMGGAASTPYATRHTSDVLGLTQLSTVGYGSPTPLELLRNLPTGIFPGIAHELIPYIRAGHLEPTVKSLLQAIAYYTKNPTRSVGEAYSCLTSDLRDQTKQLSDDGVLTAFIGAEYDCLVKPHEENADLFRSFGVMPDAGHLFAQLKSRKVARQVARLIQGKELDFSM